MTIAERVMIILAILMPVIALMMFLPKTIKQKLANKPKTKKPKKEKSKPANEFKVEPTKIEAKPEIVQPAQKSTQNHINDFKDYAEAKNRRISAPKRNYPTPNSFDFDSFRPRPTINRAKQEKPLLEEIKSLSPQLKALIISGVLDRKDFDE